MDAPFAYITSLALLISLPVQAQRAMPPPQAGATAFERVHGLPHNTVLALLQDREGFIWIGTADGLSRFDGYEFVTYRHDPADTTSLSHNTVTALLETADGTLWVGTEEGLNSFERHTGRFTQHAIFSDQPSGSVLALFEDPGGILWAVIPSGLIRYETPAGRFEVFSLDDELDIFYAASRSTNGTMWFSTLSRHGRFYQFDPITRRFQATDLPDAWGASTGAQVLVDAQDALWVGNGEVIASFEPATRRLTPLPEGTWRGEVWPDRQREGLWIEGSGTDAGILWRYAPQTHEAVPYVIDPTGTNRLTHDVRALLEDQAGAVWVGTLGGLFRLDTYTKYFSQLRQQPEAPHSLSSNTVMAIRAARHDSLLWVGTLGGGLNRVDQTTGSVTTYRHRPDDPASLCDDQVWGLHEDRTGVLWLGTDSGLCRFDPATERFTHSGDSSYVYVLAEDASGTLWAGGHVLQHIDPYHPDPRQRVIKHYTLPEINKFLGNIQAIYPADAGVIWLGTEFGGLWRFEPATETVTQFPLGTDAQAGLHSRAVRVILPHPDERTLWLGTDLGLVRFDSDTASFRPYLRRDGLPGSSVFGILPDDTGALWISTNQGLARFEHQTEHFTLYTEADGTGNTEYNRRAAFRGPEGTLYFGGLEGVTFFNPARMQPNPLAPPIVLTRIEAARRDTVRLLDAHRLDELRLSYLDYTFAFEYAALSYNNPAKNSYAYQLEGFDEGWVEADTRRRASYTNIPPGRYTFRVKGTNEDGVWNEQGIALPVVITPPWWATWWFRALVGALVLSALFAAYRYRVAHLLREERLRLRIASDLHDEIGSKLSSIALASEMVTARARLGEREHRQLTEVTHQARRMVDDLRDIVWFVNPRHDHLDDLIVRMRHVAAHTLNGTRHAFQAPADGLGTALDMERRRHLYLMYREALTNVARHARATAVDIRIARHAGTLHLTIQDNGIGFDPATAAQGEGLHNLRTRADAIGGTVRVDSTPGKGTTVSIMAKIPENRDGFLKR